MHPMTYPLLSVLAVLLLYCPVVLAQTNGAATHQEAVFSVRRPVHRATAPASVRMVKHGPTPEPALPDSSTNPVPTALADRPQDTMFRRRKLRLRMRG